MCITMELATKTIRDNNCLIIAKFVVFEMISLFFSHSLTVTTFAAMLKMLLFIFFIDYFNQPNVSELGSYPRSFVNALHQVHQSFSSDRQNKITQNGERLVTCREPSPNHRRGVKKGEKPRQKRQPRHQSLSKRTYKPIYSLAHSCPSTATLGNLKLIVKTLFKQLHHVKQMSPDFTPDNNATGSVPRERHIVRVGMMSRPGQPGALLFDGKNVTLFLKK